jgi:hypothetical protein
MLTSLAWEEARQSQNHQSWSRRRRRLQRRRRCLKGSCLVLVIEWQLRWTNCILCEIHRWLIHWYMCVSNIYYGGGNGLKMLQSLHMWWWRNLLHMRHDMESCDCNTSGVKHALGTTNHEHEHHLAFIITCCINKTVVWNMWNMTLKHGCCNCLFK